LATEAENDALPPSDALTESKKERSDANRSEAADRLSFPVLPSSRFLLSVLISPVLHLYPRCPFLFVRYGGGSILTNPLSAASIRAVTGGPPTSTTPIRPFIQSFQVPTSSLVPCLYNNNEEEGIKGKKPAQGRSIGISDDDACQPQ